MPLPLRTGTALLTLDDPPRGPSGLSMVATASGLEGDSYDFFDDDRCDHRHVCRLEDMRGSMRSVPHEDTLDPRF